MELTTRQNRTVIKLLANQGGAVWWRVGTGKTRITYAYFAMIAKEIMKDGVVPRFVVVCRREAFGDWREEMHKLELKWRCREVENEEDIFSIKTIKPVVYLVSHGKLSRLLSHFKECASILYGLAFDEGFLYKNPSTEHCKSANKLSQAVGQAIILSGSVMTARDLTDIFGQLYAINRHQCLARTLTDFRSKYLAEFKIDPNNPDSKRTKFVAAKGSGQRISDRISDSASFYFPSNNQREIVTSIRTVEPTPDQLRCFKDLKEFYEVSLRGKTLELKNAPSVITKCQQISDGFVKMEEAYLSVSSMKMDTLISQVLELTSCGEKLIIWCAFKYTVELILQRLQKLKIKAYGMHGSMPFDATSWKKMGQVAVATVASGSSVNHFRDCAYAIYYSHSFHWLHMQQSRGRNNRHDSQHKTCFYYYLQTRGSLDSFVYRIVNGSAKAEEDVINNAVKLWLMEK